MRCPRIQPGPRRAAQHFVLQTGHTLIASAGRNFTIAGPTHTTTFIRINAGQDVSARAANVLAGGELSVQAGRDIQIEAGREKRDDATSVTHQRSNPPRTPATP